MRAAGDDPTAPLDAAAPAAPELPHGTVAATCISEKKGTRKHPVDSIELVAGEGIAGDAHAGAWHRQVSLLADESVDLMRARGADLAPGDFAENVLTRGIDVKGLPVGTTVAVGPARMVVTQIGKTCHNDCEIRRITGTCVMPTDGIFCVVTRGGTVRAGDEVRVMGEDELA
ncbi:MAG: MOSC domain-containing protein [Coriobacteriaceae bacterium]|nr:MOSC domain-containing protein [Coriobacteriaceae bacterium]